MPSSSSARAKRRVLGEEAVARVEGVGRRSGATSRIFVDVQVGRGRLRRPEAVRLVRAADVERGAVGVGVDGDGLDAEVVRRANDAHGDLAAVRDEELADGAGGVLDHSGMFPCFFGGFLSRLVSSSASALISRGRVRRGSITSSM